MSNELQLYVYTKRRARVAGNPQFVELIPKLFGDLYSDREEGIENFIDKEKEELGDNFNTFSGILNYYLNKPNYINRIDNASEDDKKKLKK